MPDEPTSRATAPPARVEYSSHLWRVALVDAWSWVRRRRVGVAFSGPVIFLSAAFLVWLVREGEVGWLAPMLAGVVALLLSGAGLFAAHLLYLSPRNLCAAKQRQLDTERRRFETALDKEKQTAQLAVTERDVLKSKLEERPLRPLELRQEIDQLIEEGTALLASAENTMVGESELWFDDVERFAHRHLSPKQYDQLREASPPDINEQVLLHRAPSGAAPIPEEELAVAERLVKVSAGLKEIRQGIRG